MIPKLRSYGRYKGNGFGGQCNYGAHCMMIELGRVTIWYSYETPIAFMADADGLVMRKNDWSNTTARHMRWVSRDVEVAPVLPGKEFLRRLSSALAGRRRRTEKQKTAARLASRSLMDKRFSRILIHREG